jgi:carboxyl-terminal processing protease
LVILINSNTASSAEIFAATLQYYKKATLVGINSYGKGTIQKTFPLDHNHTLVLTIGECYPADGTILQNSGIKPDHIIEGDEEQITFAIEFIEKMFTQ